MDSGIARSTSHTAALDHQAFGLGHVGVEVISLGLFRRA